MQIIYKQRKVCVVLDVAKVAYNTIKNGFSVITLI